MHYIIADIHGCLDDLFKLLSNIEEKDKNAQYIFLGDFIDRGPSVGRTVQWMADHITENGKYQCIRGNHENDTIEWFSDNMYRIDTGYKFLQNMKNAGIKNPLQYIDFFKTLPLYKHLTVGKNSYFISHACFANSEIINDIINNGENVAEIYKKELLWSRDKGFNGNHLYIHGHTPTFTTNSGIPGFIEKTGNAINVDCGCCFAPFYYLPCRLAAYCLETGKATYSHTVRECFDNMYYKYGKPRDIIEKEYFNFQKKYFSNSENTNDDDEEEEEVILLE